MQRQTTITTWCERIIEGGWLLALVLIPSYFNLLSSRHFEPDKATTLRAIVLVMAAAGLIRMLDAMGTQPTNSSSTNNPMSRAWQWLKAIPLALPTLTYAIVFLVTTFTSVVPLTSFWGSYQRLQGTYTNLSYMALAAMIVLTLRRREQFDRLITITILGSLIAVSYGLVQHFQVDPLPWKGDVVSRVASTMGNSIFVAAYLIMILPFALYRAIVALHEAQKSPVDETGRGADWGWALAYVLVVISTLPIAFAAIKFGAVVRTADLGYWWIYPGSLFAAFGLYLLPTLRPHSAERLGLPILLPGIVAIGYVIIVGLIYLLGQSSGTQVVQAQPGRGGTDWPVWMLAGVIMIIVAYVLILTLPRRTGSPSRLFLRLSATGMILIALLLLVTIFFTQSRGPWIGTAAGVFTFFTLLFVLMYRHARAKREAHASLWRNLLIGELVVGASLVAAILVFNFSDAPIFQEWRKLPYIGRMGTLLDTSAGTTGEVRKLIWFGDDKAGGAVSLITAEPLRAIIGWGPESMFVAYNRFYPPALANVEARGASPDRSHEAYLDELVTKGVLGLISYLFLLLSFFALAWQLIRRTDAWEWQALMVACSAVVISHSIEGLTGIPIVSTLMMLWVTLAISVVGGSLAGQYSLGASTPQEESTPTDPPPSTQPTGKTQGTSAPRSSRRSQGSASRGAAQGRRAIAGRRNQAINPAGLAVYTIIMMLALAGVWFFNIDNVYADMRFQQGQNYAEGAGGDLNQEIIGMDYFLDSIRMEPEQDFYYLNLGRTLMNIADERRLDSTEIGQAAPNAEVADLLRLADTSEVQTFLLAQSPLTLLSYAQSVLERAYELNPLNKDHYANLARLYNFWYSRFSHDPAQLRLSIDWYRRGHEIAPQDVVILNEYAGSIALLGSVMQNQGNVTAAQTAFQQANTLLTESKRLDPRYSDTDVRIADVLRVQGNDTEATNRYVAIIEKTPHALDNQINLIIDSLRDKPELLRRLRDSYAAASAKAPKDTALYSFAGLLSVRIKDLPRASEFYATLTQLQPQNIDAHRNYVLVLSDTKQYAQAVTEAQTLLRLAIQQQASTQQTGAIQSLIDFLKAQAAGG